MPGARPPVVLPLFALAALLAAPLAAAHPVPAPFDHMARVLADDNDDCGGDGQVATSGNCRGSHDLIALDIQERDLGDGLELVFVYWMNKGSTFPIVDTTTFKADGAAKSLAFQTANDQSFTVNSGFGAIGAPLASGDGTRFRLEATVSAASLGVAAGATLADFRVESKAGSNLGDYMPGGCKSSPLGAECANTDTSTRRDVDYTLRGADYYARLDVPSSISAPEGGDSDVAQVTLTNPFPFRPNDPERNKQTFTISLSGLDGASGGFHVGEHGDGAAYEPTAELELRGGAQTTLHLRLHGEQAGASGTLTVTVTTSLGGRTTADIPYTVTEAAATETPTSESSHGGHASSTKGSPAPAAALAATLLLGLALRRRS